MAIFYVLQHENGSFAKKAILSENLK